MKQTAVEWLFERFIDLNADMKYSVITWEEYLSKRADLLEQAKAIEKQQIEAAYNAGREYGCKHDDPETGEQYYTENFKTESE